MQNSKSGFAALPIDTQELIRTRQAEAKRKRLEAKRAKTCSPSVSGGVSASCPPSSSSSSDCARSPQPLLGDHFPDSVSQSEYFAAASGGCFQDSRITATVSGVDSLLTCLTFPANAQLRTCNYFKFFGSTEQQWDPTLLAKLAYEGFFTITHKMRGAARAPAAVEPAPRKGGRR